MSILSLKKKWLEKKKIPNTFGDRFELLRCLEVQQIKTSIILCNGIVFEGIPNVRGLNKIRLSTKPKKEACGMFTDILFRDVVAVKFVVEDFSSLLFEPYQRKRKSIEEGTYVDELRLLDLQMEECGEYLDIYDLLLYLKEGMRQKVIHQIKIVLKGGNEFKGILKIVDKDRVLLEIQEPQEEKYYLDVHHLMISAVQFEIKDAWPYEPYE